MENLLLDVKMASKYKHPFPGKAHKARILGEYKPIGCIILSDIKVSEQTFYASFPYIGSGIKVLRESNMTKNGRQSKIYNTNAKHSSVKQISNSNLL